jgi:cholest-4-en-3-one 26-monooxygenase
VRDAAELTAEDVIDPGRYAAEGYPHEAWRALRREPRLRWFDFSPRAGFYAVVRREDIVWLSKQPALLQIGPRQAVFADSPPPRERRSHGPLQRHLLTMDPPEHGVYRKLASHWFTPRAVQRRRPEIERMCRELVDEMARGGAESEADFVEALAGPLTIGVLADMLGVPPADRGLLGFWTNRFVGAGDPEYQLDASVSETFDSARRELFAYFTDLAKRRRVAPRDDMASVLANAQLDGAPLPDFELLSYFALLVVAGNETTRNAASGGLLALIQSPGELAKLRRDPSLLPCAVEEIVRWTSPVIQFVRTPLQDLELRGQTLRAGQSLCLFYPSANRDEAVFADPDVFRVDRRPNPHLGFGVGEHFCLGANLARLELQVIFAQLARRLQRVELAGKLERMRSSFLGGVKHMPIRYRMSPA